MSELRGGRHRSVDAVVTVNGLPEPAVAPSDPAQVMMTQLAAELWPNRVEVSGEVRAIVNRARRRARTAVFLKSASMQLLGVALIALGLVDEAPPGLRLLSSGPLVAVLVVGGALVLGGPLVALRSTRRPPTHAEALVQAMHSVLVEHASRMPTPQTGSDGR